jgi:hypothetical protein
VEKRIRGRTSQRPLLVLVLALLIGASWLTSIETAQGATRGPQSPAPETRISPPPPPAAEGPPPALKRKAAIIVFNNAGTALNAHVPVLESQLSSRLASGSLTIISREATARALKVYPLGPSQVQPVFDPNATDQNLVADRNTLGTRADRHLSDNTSAMRLAQNLGADFLLLVTLNTIGVNEQAFKDENVEFVAVDAVLQANYTLFDTAHGGATAGDDFELKRRMKVGTSQRRNDGNLINELVRAAAERIALSIADTAATSAPPAPQAGATEITIIAGVQGLDGNPLMLPDIRVGRDNTVIKGARPMPIQANGTVEIDGIAMGSTPVRILILPGLHRLRIWADGYRDYEATITAAPGLTLSPTLQLSDAAILRWQEMQAFLVTLDAARKITEAQVKVLEGYAQFLKQSHIRLTNLTVVRPVSRFDLFQGLY